MNRPTEAPATRSTARTESVQRLAASPTAADCAKLRMVLFSSRFRSRHRGATPRRIKQRRCDAGAGYSVCGASVVLARVVGGCLLYGCAAGVCVCSVSAHQPLRSSRLQPCATGQRRARLRSTTARTVPAPLASLCCVSPASRPASRLRGVSCSALPSVNLPVDPVSNARDKSCAHPTRTLGAGWAQRRCHGSPWTARISSRWRGRGVLEPAGWLLGCWAQRVCRRAVW